MTQNRRDKPVILFVAEAVTLAHYARIITLANSLDPKRYKIVVASDPRYTELEPPVGCTFRSICSISSDAFAQALSHGKPLYDVETLTSYVKDDLNLIDNIKPDLIVGDFRLSLAVSAPLRKIPYAAIVNAYWSPFADIGYPVPDLPITQILGVHFAQKIFDVIRPMILAAHARPLNKVRRHFGMPSLGSDLRNVYTWSDCTLYADIPEMIPTRNLPPNHHYLGPILWSTRTLLPEWWTHLPEDKPVVFLILGSSGQIDLLPMMLRALTQLPVTVIAVTTGKITPADIPENAYFADYLPMDIVTQRSQLVISNGGSLTTYQALSKGVPIIGICSNMDQLLNMSAVERMGAGIKLRAAGMSAASLVAATTAALNDPSYRLAAGHVGRILEKADTMQRFQAFVMELLC